MSRRSVCWAKSAKNAAIEPRIPGIFQYYSIAEDELVEVTPKSIRLRKIHLDPHERKRASRQAAAG